MFLATRWYMHTPSSGGHLRGDQSSVARVAVALRSVGVGGVATLIDLSTLTLLVSALGMSARSASVPALALGVAAQFVGNKWFAFRDTSKDIWSQGLRFLVVEAAAFGMNIAIFDLLVQRSDVPYLALRVITTSAVYFGFCLPLWIRIFSAKSPIMAGT